MNKKYFPKLTKRYPQSLQHCLKDFKKSWEDLEKISKINENWKKLIGLELYEECKPLKIEKQTLTIAVNNPQWRQALIYNKHSLKERINEFGIKLNEIRIIQNYEIESSNSNRDNTKLVWEQHPIRVNKNNMKVCKICNCPSPKGEIARWGKCIFCWRKSL